MRKKIESRKDLEGLFPGLFEMYAEMKLNGGCLDVVRLERTRGSGYAPGGIFAAGRFSNHRSYRNLDGTTSFDDLLALCRDEGAAVYLDTDFSTQQKLRAGYLRDAAASENLDKED